MPLYVVDVLELLFSKDHQQFFFCFFLESYMPPGEILIKYTTARKRNIFSKNFKCDYHLDLQHCKKTGLNRNPDKTG